MAIPGRLAMPSKTNTKTIETIYAEMLSTARLDLSPPYQRERCWKQVQNNGLIDSIMRNFPLPLITVYKLHADNSDDSAAYAAGKRFECVDGQNRLWAIRSFRSGTPIINAKGEAEPVQWKAPCGALKHFADLTEEEQEYFTSFDVAVTVIQSPMTIDARMQMFLRMQDGTKISVCEYMRNTEHPVGKFIRRNNLRDLMLPVLTGAMLAAKGEWMDLAADCITLYQRRDLSVLDRVQSEMRAVLKCKKSAGLGTKYDIPVTEADDESLMRLFVPLIDLLTVAKEAKAKYHKFHVTALFWLSLTGSTIPPMERLLPWIKSHKEIVKQTKEGVKPSVIYAQLLTDLAAPLPVVEPKPKRRSIPKQKRIALWGRHFGGATEGTCQCCEKPIGILKWEQAHIEAVAAGGPNDLTNLVPTCVACNRECGQENLREWCLREYPSAPFLK